MASQVSADGAQTHSRNFHGRTIKVTMCDADPDFTAKVARIQDDILSRSDTGNATATVEDLPDSQPPPTEEAPVANNTTPIQADIGQAIENVQQSEDSVTPEETVDPVIPGSQGELGSEEIPSAANDTGDQDKSSAEDNTPEETDKASEEPGVDIAQQTRVETDGIDSQQSYPDEDAPLPNYAPNHGTGLSVFDRVDLTQYSEYEWKGATPKAALVRHGYQEIINVTSQYAMRKIRGDNYCGLRAACFQVLSQKLNVLKTWKDNFDDLMNIPQTLLNNHRCNWLNQWSFAGRLKVTPKKRLDTLKNCLQNFCDVIQISRSIPTDEERAQHFLTYFNSGNSDEVLLFEAMKLLMLHSAILLHERMAKEEDVPVFAWLLFARDTSENPEQLMLNHLNVAGDTGGLEQVEMFLLGYALNITLRVLRPSQFGEDDFVTHYPDDHLDDWDICNLIAEDDRHYNIIVS